MYIFLSCQRELSTIRTYVLASVGISVFGLAVVFVMIYFFSGKILKPVSESYEKQKVRMNGQAAPENRWHA